MPKNEKKQSYTQKLKTSYSIGYKQGWKDRAQIPDCFLSRTVATRGYSTGMRDYSRSQNYQKKLKK